ncbi:hypothetical protein DPMN_048985 [Dreissena polymorpha]|uniref:Uncharacterized protein n=1 Tax=Dreissena polymorpha TaxID=45954 RepID=A0A9D4DED9_DREPO|nr:hypothetical protein DPMN_048985 [Dreissena polymorpha]
MHAHLYYASLELVGCNLHNEMYCQHCVISNPTPPQRLGIIKLLTNKDLRHHDPWVPSLGAHGEPKPNTLEVAHLYITRLNMAKLTFIFS